MFMDREKKTAEFVVKLTIDFSSANKYYIIDTL